MTVSEAFTLALDYHQSGRLAEAENIYRQILALEPDHANALHFLGMVETQTNRAASGVELMRRALALFPGSAEFHSNLGKVLHEQGHREEAIVALRNALQLQPDYPQAQNNLGCVLRDQGDVNAAIAAFRRAIELQPTYANAHNSLGASLGEQGEFDQAIAMLQRALQLRPDFAEAHYNLGFVLTEYGQPEAAIAFYRRALQLEPASAKTHSNLLLTLHYLPKCGEAAIFEEHRRWDEIHARPLAKLIGSHRNDQAQDRRLRIGYVSPDFRKHPVACFLEGLLANHDPSRVEVFCYAELARADEYSERLRRHAGHWCTIKGMSDEQAAEVVREDKIDLLVDLAGHTAHSRLLVFARKPAPVQVTYLGYCDTTGMKAMDYRLTDAHADPPGTTEHFCTERLLRVPECAWCFRAFEDSPPVQRPPIQHTGRITFGCFNARAKITDEMLALWARLLLQVPASRLLLKNQGFGAPSAQQRAREILAKAGLAPERVEFMGHLDTSAEHLSCYERVDIALDTFPYHGTTTTCEALWMGVPVVTLEGGTHASRVGVSLLTNVGLPELIAANADDYLRIAADLADDPCRLEVLRTSLRERMATSPLMDAPRFARNVEAAYRQIWRAWCAKQGSNTAP